MPDETYTPDNLISGTETAAIVRAGVLLSGQNLLRKTVLGAITRVLGAATFVGTGNGTLTGVALKKATQLGDYLIECITAAANGGVFSVVAPNGDRLADAKVGVAYANDEIAFTLNDGVTDYIVGDKFTIPVTAGSGKLKKLDKAAVDGSQNPVLILAEDCDASAGDKPCVGYETGIFNPAALILADGTVAADIETALRLRGIFLRAMRTL